MKNFKTWFNAFFLVLLFTNIIDILVSTSGHSANSKKTVITIITLSVLLSALLIRNLFVLNKKKNKK